MGKTIKIIDLLNKKANGEEVPEKIKYKNIIWYFNKKDKTYYMNNTEIELFYIEKLIEKLNDEVEIIEEDKKIEKINIKWDKDYYVLDEDNVKIYLNERDKIEMNKINEIINYLMENK